MRVPAGSRDSLGRGGSGPGGEEVDSVQEEDSNRHDAWRHHQSPLQPCCIDGDVRHEMVSHEEQRDRQSCENGEPAQRLQWDEAEQGHRDRRCERVPTDTDHLPEVDAGDLFSGEEERRPCNHRHGKQKPVDDAGRHAHEAIIRLEAAVIPHREQPREVPRGGQEQHRSCSNPEGAVEVRAIPQLLLRCRTRRRVWNQGQP
mmetsp:Transcript_82546/g.267396  ORF Transcript_82546/g.267396 Transcript_82546/m.267396 type:complete len:201 (-) Transcript_82546:709-1311(-)